MSTIFVNELKSIFDRVIDKLRQDNLEKVTLDTDLYRIIPTDEWETYERDVVEVGSLNDDIESLLLILKDPDRPCTYVDFDRLASLLRAISQKNNPPLS